jgi:Flp pilus assembly pilin Flp
VAGSSPATLELGLIASLGAVILIAIVVAVYGAVKSRGLNNAQAAAVSSVLFLLLFIAAIVVQLFTGS